MSNPLHLPEEVLARLDAPLDLTRVRTRKAPGGGEVPYLMGYDAIRTANEIFNFAWSMRITGPIQHVRTMDRPRTRWDAQARQKVALLDEDGHPLSDPTGVYYVIVEVEACGVVHADVGRCSYTGETPEAHDTAIAYAARPFSYHLLDRTEWGGQAENPRWPGFKSGPLYYAFVGLNEQAALTQLEIVLEQYCPHLDLETVAGRARKVADQCGGPPALLVSAKVLEAAPGPEKGAG